MAKNGVFKKIAALTLAIALVVCFAVSASAINVLTTTAYVTGTEDIKVNVTVTGIDEGANVTYYAKNGAADVHIDQAKATASGASFEFNTAATNLESTVKVGYTGASAAADAVIEGYTVTYPAGSKVIPTAATTVSFPYTLGEGKVFEAVNVSAGTATIANAEYANGNVTVTFTAISSDVTLAVVEAAAPIETPTATAEAIEAAAVVVKANAEYDEGIKIDGVKESLDKDAADVKDADVIAGANADKVGDRKLTVIGKVSAASAYGVVISETEITTGVINAAAFANLNSYAGATKNDEGVFAIQLIDTSAADSEDAFVKAGTTYYTAIYALDANGAYVITAGATVTAN